MLDALTDRAAALVPDEGRAILGIVGAPGAGKSTLVAQLLESLTARGVGVGWLPMDGFHLADAQLERLGRLGRKGAIDTFDDRGYLAMLERLLRERDETVFAPGFERQLEQPIAAALAIEPDARLVLTEGNYLLAQQGAWPRARALLAETWFVRVADQLRRERLVARHVRYGKPADDAHRWVMEVDEPNAVTITAAEASADLVVDLP